MPSGFHPSQWRKNEPHVPNGGDPDDGLGGRGPGHALEPMNHKKYLKIRNAKAGRAGRGKSKVRGNSEYYRQLGLKSAQARKVNK